MRVNRLVSFSLAAALAAPLAAQNLAPNPGFDTGLDGWSAVAFFQTQWNALDANESPGSGSARASADTGSGPALRTCQPVDAGTRYAFSVKGRRTEPGNLVADVLFYEGENCDGARLDTASVDSDPSGGPKAWYTGSVVREAPAGSHSAELALWSTTTLQGTANTSYFDDVYFGPAAPATCVPDATTLCLDDGPADRRFQVKAAYSTTQGGGLSGTGHSVALDSLGVGKGGLFWFFAADNPEALVKVLNGCSLTQFFWVFLSAGTNVNVDLFVGDTATGAVTLFHNPDLSPFPAIQNTLAIPCSPADL